MPSGVRGPLGSGGFADCVVSVPCKPLHQWSSHCLIYTYDFIRYFTHLENKMHNYRDTLWHTQKQNEPCQLHSCFHLVRNFQADLTNSYCLHHNPLCHGATQAKAQGLRTASTIIMLTNLHPCLCPSSDQDTNRNREHTATRNISCCPKHPGATTLISEPRSPTLPGAHLLQTGRTK